MKRTISLFLSIILVMGILTSLPVIASAESAVLVDYEISSDGKSYIASGCYRYSIGKVVIPDTYRGLPVTGIKAGAFSGCVAISTVTISKNVTFIGDGAFNSCGAIETVTIGSGIKSIGDKVFFSCRALTAINIDPQNAYYTSVDGVLFNKDKTKLIKYPEGNSNTSYAIPDSVTNIADYSFYGCRNLSSVIIPDSVTTIGYYAFACCSVLDSVKLGSGLKNISDLAFYECESLEFISIPDSVISIGNSVFSNCSGLSSVRIGASVKDIGNNVFYRNSSLTTITVDTKNAYYASLDGVLFDKTLNTLLIYPFAKKASPYIIPGSVTCVDKNAFRSCEGLESLIIPASITNISDRMFEGCINLKNVTISDGIISIGNGSFYDCNKLETINIPDTVTYIGSSAFENCYNLTAVTIPDTVTSINYGAFSYCVNLENIIISGSITSIPDYAFYCCENLASITICEGVTSIGSCAFYLCDSLESITIPDSVTSIGSCAFCYCDSLESITIPDGVTSIGNYAFNDCESLNTCIISAGLIDLGKRVFEYCDSLASISVDSKNPKFSSVDGVLFNKDKTELIRYPEGNSNISYAIPDGVKDICDYAFYGCDNLTAITIPNSVTNVGEDAFARTGYFNNADNWENDVLYIGNYLITAKNSVRGTYKIKPGTKIIADKALVNSSYLEWVIVPDSITHIGNQALGYDYSYGEYDEWDYYKIYKFKIVGTEGSAAEGYAKKEGFEFVDINKKIATPKLTKLSAAKDGTILTWDAVNGVDSYNIYRKTYNDKTKKWSGWSKLETSYKKTSYTDTTAKSGTYYRYTVRAVNPVSTSGFSSYGLKIKFLATPKLTSVENLKGKTSVEWSKVNGATGYIVYRKTYNASTNRWSSWSRVAVTKNNYYKDASVKSGVYYKYTVRAYCNGGDYVSSFDSNGIYLIHLTTPVLKSVSSNKNGVKLTWGMVSGAEGYYVYRKTYADGKWSGWSRITTIDKGSTITFTDKTAKKGVSYRYTVRAISNSYRSYFDTKGLQIKDKY